MMNQRATHIILAMAMVAMVGNVAGAEYRHRPPYRYQASMYQFPTRLDQKSKKNQKIPPKRLSVNARFDTDKRRGVSKSKSRKKSVTQRQKTRGSGMRFVAPVHRKQPKKPTKHTIAYSSYRPAYQSLQVRHGEQVSDQQKSVLCSRCEVDYLEKCPACSQNSKQTVMFCPSCDAHERHDKRHHWTGASVE